MRFFRYLALLSLLVLPRTCVAQNPGEVKKSMQGNFDFTGKKEPYKGWYLYWPMPAHFQTPAPMTYPFWPAPQTPPGVGAPLRPVGYFSAPPPYWYGR